MPRQEEPDENGARTSPQKLPTSSEHASARSATHSATTVEITPCHFLATGRTKGSTPKNVRRQYRREEGRRLINGSLKTRRNKTCQGSIFIRTNPAAVENPGADRRLNAVLALYCVISTAGRRKRKCKEMWAEIPGSTAEFLRLCQETCSGKTPRDIVVEKTCLLVCHESTFQKTFRETDNNAVANLYENHFQNSL